MTTDIGRGLRGWQAWAAFAVGLGAVACDFWLVRWHHHTASEGRWPLALVASAACLRLAGGNLPTVGLTGPAGGWARWVKLAAALAAAAGIVMAAALHLWVAAGWALPVRSVRPTDIGRAFVFACVYAPLLEETLYRVVVCVPLAAVASPGWAVAVSGVVFGLLHVGYGNPSPENALGGFFLAWAYLRSGSVLVPILLHAGGNLLVLGGQVAAWYAVGDL